MEIFLYKTRRLLCGILLLAVFLQIVIFQQRTVVIGGLVSFLCFVLYSKVVLQEEIIKYHPLSFFALSGMQLFTYFAPIATLLDRHPISYKMSHPSETFFWQLLYVGVTIFAFLCSKVVTKKLPLIRKLFSTIGYFKPVGKRTLWVMGGVGVLIQIYLLRHQFGDESIRGAGTLNMFRPFLLAPYCVLFQRSARKNRHRIRNVMLLLYTIFILALSVASNSRGNIAFVLLGFALIYFLYLFYIHRERLQNIVPMSIKQLVLLALLVWFILGPLSDFAIAMVSVRTIRTDVTAKELFHETIDLVQDRVKMETVHKLASSIDGLGANEDWDEQYVSNVFLQRICNYLVADETIHYAHLAGIPNREMREDQLVRLKLMFPQPIVNFFFGRLNKKDYANSPMDKLISQYKGEDYASFLVGGDVGLGLATMGYSFPLFQFLVYLLLFSFFDQLVKKKGGKVVVPVMTLVYASSAFNFFMVSGGIFMRFVSLLWAIPVGLVLCTFAIRILNKVFR